MSIATGQQRLAASLQGALTEAEVTKVYLSAVPSIIGARGHGFYRFDPSSATPATVAANVSPEFLADYEERGRCDDPVLNFVRANLRPVDDTRACSQRAWHSSSVHDVLRRAGFYHSLEAPVVVSGQLIGTINFARGPSDRPFSCADMQAASAAAEQLGLAVERALRFERTVARATMLEAALDRLPQAVVVTGLDGTVRYTNRAAARPSVSGNSLLDLVSPQIAAAVAAFREQRQRIAVSSYGHGQVIVKSVRLPEESDAALTLIYSCERGSASLPLWDLLSPREQQIADWVSQGLTTRQIAERAVVTENTVKQHLKRIFVKTDVANRAELVQRIWAARQSQQPK
jgi:DNA-binding CsgD family transcriptional regulator